MILVSRLKLLLHYCNTIMKFSDNEHYVYEYKVGGEVHNRKYEFWAVMDGSISILI